MKNLYAESYKYLYKFKLNISPFKGRYDQKISFKKADIFHFFAWKVVNLVDVFYKYVF